MFRLFGFDVKVRPGFLVFVALILFINPGRFGIWLAGSIAGFTLLHEFGHALAARSSGAEASISLDFMAGYTSFQPRHPLGKARRALISASGPATQIVASVAVLAAMGVNPLSLDSVRGSDAALAIWWAGPVIGALNLIPVLPLDGGHLAQTGLEAVLHRPALREMAIASLVVTAGTAVVLAAVGFSGFVIFIAFLVIGQVQLVQATSPRRRTVGGRPSAWDSDGLALTPGARPSPWQQAYRAVVAGDPARASRLIVDDLTRDPGAGPRWAPPSDAPLEALRAVVDTLPPDLPPGNPFSETVLVQVLLATGHPKQAGEYAAEGFGRHRTPLLAAVVARAAARLGDPSNALLWVRAAAEATQHAAADERAAVAHVLDHAPELAPLRADPVFRSARTALG